MKKFSLNQEANQKKHIFQDGKRCLVKTSLGFYYLFLMWAKKSYPSFQDWFFAGKAEANKKHSNCTVKTTTVTKKDAFCLTTCPDPAWFNVHTFCPHLSYIQLWPSYLCYLLGRMRCLTPYHYCMIYTTLTFLILLSRISPCFHFPTILFTVWRGRAKQTLRCCIQASSQL